MIGLRWSSRIAVVALAALGACEKASGPEPTSVPQPPEAVVLTVSATSLSGAAGGLRAYAEAVRPGSAIAMGDPVFANMLARAAGADSLDGLDLSGPVHLIVADGPSRTVVVGKAADKGALEKARGGAHLLVKDGWALVGPRDAVELVAGWAVPGLVAVRPKSAVEATVHVDRLMTRHAAEVTRMRDMAATQLAASDPTSGGVVVEYMTALFNLAGDTSRLVVAFDIDAKSADLDLALVPKPSSQLAGFVAAQKPSDFSLLESLPAAAPTGMVMAGRLAFGPYRAAAVGMFTRMMNIGEGAMFEKLFTTLADLCTGDFAAAFAIAPTGVTMVEVISVSDAAATEKAVREVVVATAAGTQVSSMGIRLTHTGRADLAQHGGSPIHGVTTTVDLDSVPPLQRDMMARMYGAGGQKMHLAFPRGALIASIGDVALAEQAIDAASKKADHLRLGPSLTSFFQASRARRDSLLFVMDLVAMLETFRGAMMPGAPPPPPAAAAPLPGLAMSLGFADRAAHLRFTLLSETTRALVAAVAPPR